MECALDKAVTSAEWDVACSDDPMERAQMLLQMKDIMTLRRKAGKAITEKLTKRCYKI